MCLLHHQQSHVKGEDGECSYNRANTKESVHICAMRHSGDAQECGTGGDVYTDTN